MERQCNQQTHIQLTYLLQLSDRVLKIKLTHSVKAAVEDGNRHEQGVSAEK